ncbi:MAG: amino acid ABC transporter substrate-binding protein [Cyanobacteria bacterium CRU_2_1]|nr:amino acid ABC transporter substrate-binding protein [Cyanobacteria bacterium RU_5_0]NJR58722.1 amino acid ABC transporter substrate-binding protein [Cyanobacteria bacterium CRU_2_1]
MDGDRRVISRRTFLGSTAGFSVALLLHACSSSKDIAEQNRSADVLKVGANIGNVPWEFREADGEIVGFEIDLVKAIGDRLNRQVEFIDTPFTALFPAVLSNRIHVAVSSITITKKRLKTLDFAQPYYDSDQSLTVKSDSGIQSVADLKGKVVAVDNSSTGEAWALAHKEQYGFAEILHYEGLNPAMMDLEADKFDGYISDIPSLLYYTKEKPDLKVVQRIPTGEQYSIIFAKRNPLRDEMNQIITTLKQDGTIAQIYQKWFGIAPEAGTSTAEVLAVPTL